MKNPFKQAEFIFFYNLREAFAKVYKNLHIDVEFTQ